MGSVDIVKVQCPSCHEDIEFQSKAGYCRMDTFDMTSVPLCIADDINRDTTTCKECGRIVMVYCNLPDTVVVHATIVIK